MGSAASITLGQIETTMALSPSPCSTRSSRVPGYALAEVWVLMFAPPWHSGLLASTIACGLVFDGEQSQLCPSASVQLLGVFNGNVQAYCRSSNFGMLCSWPLIGLSWGLLDVAGEIDTPAMAFVPERTLGVSIMNGSVGGVGGFAPGSPSRARQRPFSVSSLAVK